MLRYLQILLTFSTSSSSQRVDKVFVEMLTQSYGFLFMEIGVHQYHVIQCHVVSSIVMPLSSNMPSFSVRPPMSCLRLVMLIHALSTWCFYQCVMSYFRQMSCHYLVMLTQYFEHVVFLLVCGAMSSFRSCLHPMLYHVDQCHAFFQ